MAATRWIVAAVLLAFGLVTGVPWWLSEDVPWFLGVPSALFMAGGVFFALGWQRWTFDSSAGTVRFESLLWGTWEARLSTVTGFTITTREHGPAGEKTSVDKLMMTVEGRAKPARINSSMDGQFIRALKERIEGMVEPWRRFQMQPEKLP